MSGIVTANDSPQPEYIVIPIEQWVDYEWLVYGPSVAVEWFKDDPNNPVLVVRLVFVLLCILFFS